MTQEFPHTPSLLESKRMKSFSQNKTTSQIKTFANTFLTPVESSPTNFYCISFHDIFTMPRDHYPVKLKPQTKLFFEGGKNINIRQPWHTGVGRKTMICQKSFFIRDECYVTVLKSLRRRKTLSPCRAWKPDFFAGRTNYAATPKMCPLKGT